jgi:TatD DNase family protein
VIVDSHCHLDDPEFDRDREAVVARARAAGVYAQIVPAIDRGSWEKTRAACTLAPGLHPAYGLHPLLLERHRPEHLDELAQWLEREAPKAVGECGLDYYVEGLDADAQRMYFRRQLELARDFGLPVIVHARRAFEEAIAELRRLPGLRGVVHSWAGSEEQARQLFAMGFCLGLGGPVTYERARRIRRVAASMPLEFLLLETDAPDQPDSGRRGERNEPAHLPTVLECIAQLRGVEPEEVARATTANACRLFGLELPQAPRRRASPSA